MASMFAGPSRRQHGENAFAECRGDDRLQPFASGGTLRYRRSIAQFEQVRLGLPDDVPIICAQWNSIIAVNYPARKFGIKRMTLIEDAKKLCPDLVVQHVATYREGESEAGYWDDVDRRTHKVSLDPYRRESLKILAVFREMAPTAELEKASIDEAFLDLTPMVIERILSSYPYIATVPDDAPDGLDMPLPPPPAIDWSRAGSVFPLQVDDETEVDVEGRGWHMARSRTVYRRRDHGGRIAHNKTIAKLCSAWKKPNAQTVMRLEATPGFLRDMDFTDIRFLGGKLGSAMAAEFNAKTVGDMLGPTGQVWRREHMGVQHSEEVKEKLATKSMLASKNTIPNVRTAEQGHHWLSVLAGELNVRLREARGVTPGLWPKTLVLSIRSSGAGASHSRQAPFPFTRNLSTEYIVKHARKLWDESTQPLAKGTMKLSNIGLAFTSLDKLEEGQQGIEGFFKTGNVEKRPRETTVLSNDSSSKRPRLPTLHTKPKPNALESFLAQGRGTPPPVVKDEIKDSSHPTPDARPSPSTPPAADTPGAWQCPKCDTTFTAPPGVPADEQKAWISHARQEHDDYHFALLLPPAG
ncbi:DNA-directed DNA polymerase eta rad30 [Apiotrichum porosum]|uniref:DNA polymerase eta n=1 Tax=Apiotrichum porosum TaxID=105984 RepID=A0A427Y5W3_9TREE|nr:DNA-directed DNA polymerase eta rad30 [Apiotrichum porosum]RSH86475.1 DNA-directed DNA polymerase eta rad30 [Apiotrichum porosum]